MAYLDDTATHRFTLFSNLARAGYTRLGKRLLDIALAILLLPFLAPVIVGLWALVRSQGSPGFFRHTRVGRHGTAFGCWKICTMVPNAEALLAQYLKDNPEAASEWDQSQKLARDPRITRLGRFLRRTSLDELPQIWNVLRGEMSFVGPRPVTEPELKRYGADTSIYLDLRPGVTGLWQVEGRSNGCYNERRNMDRAYAATIGLLRDLTLIFRTGFVIFWPTGR